jgi:hypothetical protein
MDRRLSGFQSQSGRREIDKKTFAPAGIRAPVVQPVTIPTELSRLLPSYFTQIKARIVRVGKLEPRIWDNWPLQG